MEALLEQAGDLPGTHTKNLFMKDKKKKGLWLLSTRHNVEIKLNELSKKVNAPGGLRFADEAILTEVLGVRGGCVTAFALINDKEHKVKFLIDDDLLSGEIDPVILHPLSNDASTSISSKDLLKFFDYTGHDPIRVKFDTLESNPE